MLTTRDLDKSLGVFFGLETVGIRSDPDDEANAEEVLAKRRFREELEYSGRRYTVPLLRVMLRTMPEQNGRVPHSVA